MKLKIKKIVLMALYVSLFAVFSVFCTINAFSLKLTLQNLPLYIASITLGSTCGGIVGFLGSLTNQMITYGFSATTLLWVLPHMITGFITGLIFEKKIVKKIDFKFFVVIIFANIMLTIMNTVVTYIDSILYSYYSFVAVFGAFVLRLMASVLTAIVYCIIIPTILIFYKKISKYSS